MYVVVAMQKVSLWTSPIQPASFEEAVSLFFAKKRRRTAVKLWKWFTKKPLAHPIELIEFAIEVTGSYDLLDYYTRLVVTVENPLSYEGMLEIKKNLLEKATELGVDFKKVLDDVEYTVDVMKALGVLVNAGGILVYTPNALVRFLRKIAWEIERG